MELKGLTVAPFILRGVALKGIDSVFKDMPTRKKVYEKYAPLLTQSGKLDLVTHGEEQIIGLEQVPEAAKQILDGKVKGRFVVKL